MLRVITAVLLMASTVLFATSSNQCLAEWSTYRGDAYRSAYTADSLPDDLKLAWSYHASSPSVAWSPPAKRSLWQQLDKIAPRVNDDQVYHPVTNEDSVFFGSSSDDQVRCLDLHTGLLKWSFIAGGPIRFAPTIQSGLLYFGSDDGQVYCLNAKTGSLQWSRSVAPESENNTSELKRIQGNGRLISPWPVRTGIVIDGPVLFAAAGLLPTQGTYATALDSQSGEVLWRIPLPEVSPQGYLLLSNDRLYIPTGRSNPVSVNRTNGNDLRQYGGVGGSYAVIADDVLYAGRGNDGKLIANQQETADQLIELLGQQMVISKDLAFLQTETHLSAIDRKSQIKLAIERLETTRQRDRLAKQRSGTSPPSVADAAINTQISNLDKKIASLELSIKQCQLWVIPNRLGGALAIADNKIVAAGEGGVAIFAADDGRSLWQAEIDGKVGGIAIHKNFLVLTCTDGRIIIFGPTASETGQATNAPSQPNPIQIGDEILTGWNASSESVSQVIQALDQATDIRDGFCVVAGVGDSELCRRIAEETRFRVVLISDDPQQARSLQHLASQAGIATAKLSVILATGNTLPLTDYIATAVVIHDATPRSWPTEELQRLVRPFGGVLVDASLPSDSESPKVDITRRGPLDGSGSWRHLYGSPANTASSDDSYIRKDLRLQWFGTLGPREMIDRHLRGPAPLAHYGRLAVFGDNVVFCLDAYSGLLQWQLPLPQSQRYSIPYDAGHAAIDSEYLFLAVNEQMWQVDAASGEVVRKIDNPAGNQMHWGYLAEQDGQLIGTTQRPNAARTVASRRGIDEDYRSGQGLVTSESLFVMPRGAEQPTWEFKANGSILNPTITVNTEAVYFVTVSSQPKTRSPRLPLSEIKQDTTELVCLDLSDGQVRWKKQIDLSKFKNIVYLAVAENRLVLSGSQDGNNAQASYHIEVRDAGSGTIVWDREHLGRSGDLYHGEQVQHPVVMGTMLISEPHIFDMTSGEMLLPDGAPGEWAFRRPGHSCGSITAANNCLFFRANNPVRMALGNVQTEDQRFLSLAPSRTGCWINAIPAQGLVMIPEASAGCVCNYALQTSMAFLPVEP